MLLSLSVVIAYFLGSCSVAILTSKVMRLPDPRSQGSRNPGATNMLRIGGKYIALTVFIGDFLKGALAVLLARRLNLPSADLGWVVLAAFLGHLYPVFFKFKGGKGVATALGGLMAFNDLLAFLGMACWLAVFVLSRYISLASIFSAAAVAIGGIWLATTGTYVPIFLICLLLIIRHYKNITRLLRGEENRIRLKN